MDGDASIDEYEVFKSIMGAMESQGNANEWFRALLASLSEDHAKKIKEIITLCDQRKAAKESKSIEQAGGQ